MLKVEEKRLGDKKKIRNVQEVTNSCVQSLQAFPVVSMRDCPKQVFVLALVSNISYQTHIQAQTLSYFLFTVYLVKMTNE